MKKALIICLLLLLIGNVYSQKQIDTLAWIKHTFIKDQQNSGTCWSFGTTSFIESEILRQNPQIDDIDISEMYFVYYNYLNKLQRYYLLTGFMYWTMGGQPHDVFNVIRKHGFVPEDEYQAYTAPHRGHNHELLDSSLVYVIKKLSYKKELDFWQKKFKDSLDTHLGAITDSFFYNEKYINGSDFSDIMGINPENYITLTSYSHHPYFKGFTLEDKFNWAGELYYNIPWQNFENICDSALVNGYSFVWDGDVSETGFRYDKGTATLPEIITNIEETRLKTFFNHESKIDHVMHIVGLVKKNGEVFYVVKNSWGKIGTYKGYILMSKDFFRIKTVAITINVEALPVYLKNKL